MYIVLISKCIFCVYTYIYVHCAYQQMHILCVYIYTYALAAFDRRFTARKNVKKVDLYLYLFVCSFYI